MIDEVMNQVVTTGKAQTLWLESKGIDEAGDEVSTFSFQWTLLLKQ